MDSRDILLVLNYIEERRLLRSKSEKGIEMSFLKRVFRKKPEYFCPNCNADLTKQAGFDPDEGRWACTECGMQLYDEQYEGELYKDVLWYCDKCGAFLNKQEGFSEFLEKWTCTDCGHINPITDRDIYIKAKQPVEEADVVDCHDEDKPLTEKEIMKLLKDIPFPKGYERQKLPRKFKKMNLFPEQSLIYGVNSGEGSGLITLMTASQEAAMPFDKPQQIIDDLHAEMPDNQGIIEVNCGVTRAGHRFAYDIFKILDESDGFPRVSWVVNVNVEREDVILFLNASYQEEGITGVRDSTVMAMLSQQEDTNIEKIMERWAEDPYDPEYKQGFRMNLSEKAELDTMFPNHPLSMIRELIRFISENW